MLRHLRVYRLFLATSLRRELEFRVNFLFKVLQNVLWVFFFVIIVLVIYRNTDSVAGWNRGNAWVLTAASIILSSTFLGFFMSLLEIPEMVRKGSLDFVVTKPVDPQFWISCRKFNFDQIGPFIAGWVMLFVGIHQSGLHPGVLDWFGFLLLQSVAVVLMYSLNLFGMTLGIWFVRVDNLWVLGETVNWVARYPIEIYSTWLQRVFIYVVPFAFFSALPASQLVRGFNPSMVLLGLFWAALAFTLVRMFWLRAQRSYSSASS